MPEISVITVVRNDQAGIISTINSVISQDYAHYEYTVQDGASTDVTAEIIRQYKEWIDVFTSERDCGIYDAMTRAIGKCTGDWVIFMNSSDSFAAPDVLSNFASNVRDEDQIVFGQALDIDTGKVHQYRSKDQIWLGSIFDHQACFARRELFEELPFDTDLRIAGDLDFFGRAHKRGVSFREIDLLVAKKPFSVGASSDFMDRFKERKIVQMRNFGDKYPVEDGLRRELLNHISRKFELKRELLENCKLSELEGLYDRLASVAN